MALSIWGKYSVTQYTEWYAAFAYPVPNVEGNGFTLCSSYSVDSGGFWRQGSVFEMDIGLTGYFIFDGTATMSYKSNIRQSPNPYYKYISDGLTFNKASRTAYRQGAYITTVTAEQNTYPHNGRHTDGYWYTYQGSALDFKANINGVWKDLTTFQNVNGVWKQSNEIKSNINGVWK